MTAALLAVIVIGLEPAQAADNSNPCELLTAAEIAAVTGLPITSARREPSIAEIVRAQEADVEPEPGSLCVYQTSRDFGSIVVSLLPGVEGQYWTARDEYFHSFPGAAEHVPDLGVDAWIGGGSSLRVLVADNVQLAVSTQMYQPRSRHVVVDVARAVLLRLRR